MNVWGAQVRPPTMDRALAAWLLNAGFMGRAERRFFEKAVTPGQTVVDVGANQCVFTLLFSRLVGPDGRVFALEPAPALFGALDKNCRINAANNVTRLPIAAGETRSQGVLHCSRFNGGDNRLTDSLKGPTVPVEIVPLDEFLPPDQVSLVKIDVQGYELNVVKGMQAIMDRSPAIKVFFEYWPSGLGYAGCTPGELLDFFIDRRFSLFELSRAGLRKLQGHDVARSTKAGDWSWRNLLAARE
ncbi:MAG: FkbM family methyltransferase [Acidobacteria bacterium]|nr:FkbM family methyltransferase [Acidobacteriota bacterium]